MFHFQERKPFHPLALKRIFILRVSQANRRCESRWEFVLMCTHMTATNLIKRMTPSYFYYETQENLRDRCVTAFCSYTAVHRQSSKTSLVIARKIEFSCSLARCVSRTCGEECGLLAALYHLWQTEHSLGASFLLSSIKYISNVFLLRPACPSPGPPVFTTFFTSTRFCFSSTSVHPLPLISSGSAFISWVMPLKAHV